MPNMEGNQQPEIAKEPQYAIEEGTRNVLEPEIPEGNSYDYLFDPNSSVPTTVEDAAVRPERDTSPRTETIRQMGIAAADRKTREDAGLPPREYDLR